MAQQTAEFLARKIERYLIIRRDKKHEDYLKSKPKKNKKTGVVSKGINTRLAAIVKRLTDKSEDVRTIEKTKKSKGQSALDFQLNKYQSFINLLDNEQTDSELHELTCEYTDFVSELERQHQTSNWLDEWVTKAKDISFATHVAKLTHSSSKGSSILDSSICKDDRYLTTNTLPNPEMDTASSNAASLPVSDVLKISNEKVSVLDCIKAGDYALFDYFTEDKNKVSQWVNALKQAYDSDEKKSYFLSKQVYFPAENEPYHLLLPLTSSSLVQALHNEHRRYFEDEQTLARKQKNNGQYSAIPVISYPNKAIFNVTSRSPKAWANVSTLNLERKSKITLFSCQPPNWQTQSPNYINVESHQFFGKIGYLLKTEINELNKYLRLLNNKELSISKPERALAITKKVNAIVHALFDEVLLANDVQQRNWTQESNFTIPYQLLFEPYRDDEQAKQYKLGNQWQVEISKDFARWLNKQLDKKRLGLNTIHEQLWQELFARELREFIAIQEVSQ